MGLRHLRIVLTVAESGSISRAAATLKIAQSGLSTQLTRIEQELGGPLFRRGPQGVVPTELGVHVVGRARALLDEFGSARHGASARRAGRTAAGRRAGRRRQPLGAADRRTHPGAAAAPRTADLLGTLLAGRAGLLRTEKIALAVISEFPDVGPPAVREFTVRDLGTEPVLIGLAPGHRLAHRQLITLEELADEIWVAPGDRSDGLGLSLRIASSGPDSPRGSWYLGADQTTAAALVGAGERDRRLRRTGRPLPRHQHEAAGRRAAVARDPAGRGRRARRWPAKPRT